MSGQGADTTILVGDIQFRLLQRLSIGPALMADLVAAAYAGRAAPRNAGSSVSTLLHRLAGLGFDIDKSLRSGAFKLAAGGPAFAKRPNPPPPWMAMGGDTVSSETGVPRETPPGAMLAGSRADDLVRRVLANTAADGGRA